MNLEAACLRCRHDRTDQRRLAHTRAAIDENDAVILGHVVNELFSGPDAGSPGAATAVERRAAAIYRQAEALQSAHDVDGAVATFLSGEWPPTASGA